MTLEAKLDRIIEILEAGARKLVAAEVATGAEPVAAVATRTRGRAAKGEATAATASTVAPVAVSATVVTESVASTSLSDPFADAPRVQTKTLDDVRTAAKAYGKLTDQATAVALMKSVSGHESLGTLPADTYDAVVLAFNKAAESFVVVRPESNPFDDEPVVAAKAVTLDEVKNVIVKTQKRTAQDAAQGVVMAHGGKAAGANGAFGPSLKALPASEYAKVIAALEALATTK
jgi:hypothetical protein